MPTRLVLHLSWRDQGWGAMTGRMRALLRSGRPRGRYAEGEAIATADCFGLCAAPRAPLQPHARVLCRPPETAPEPQTYACA